MQLPRVMDLSAAAPLWSELSGMRAGPVELDASNVERVGGLCLQVLIAAAAAWRAAGRDFRIVAPSEAFVANLQHMGAEQLLTATGER